MVHNKTHITVMNPVHAALRNCDILQVIMDFLKVYHGRNSGRRDLVAAALVCHVFSDLALDVLWRHIDMDNVNFLFLVSSGHNLCIISTHKGQQFLVQSGTLKMTSRYLHPGQYLKCIPTTPQQWERFDVYASRIRSLWALASSDDLFLHGARMRYPTSPPFPNLTCLKWLSAPSQSIDAMIFICPTLVEVELKIDEQGEDEDARDALADVLWSLGEKCSRLRKFEYTHLSNFNDRSRSVETALIHLIRQCRRLEDVDLPISRDLLRALGSLPHLSTLRLGYVTWEDESQLYLPIQVDEWSEETDRFPALDDLTIQCWHTVSSLTECFQGSGCFPRESFTMWKMFESEKWSTLAIAEFLRGILRPDRGEGLRVFCIDREPVVHNPVGHDSWKSLRFLSSFPNLRTLSLRGLFLDIKDTDLEEIPRIWPELRTLRLDVPYYKEGQSHISFQGLAHLSALDNLETVSLMLAPESMISESMLSHSTCSNSRLKRLHIQGKFPSVTPHAVTTFLFLHFPKLEIIDTSLSSDEQEGQPINEI